MNDRSFYLWAICTSCGLRNIPENKGCFKCARAIKTVFIPEINTWLDIDRYDTKYCCQVQVIKK